VENKDTGCDDFYWVCTDVDQIWMWVLQIWQEALSSTTGTQNFEIFQNDTDEVVFLELSNKMMIMYWSACYWLSVFGIRVTRIRCELKADEMGGN
jgi:hypothetical protein